MVCVHAQLIQSCLTICNPMDLSLPGFSVHGISQARLLEWVAMPSSKGSVWPRYQTCASWVSCIAGRLFTTEPLGQPTAIGYESWTVKKAECQKIDAFELWCWRRLLRVPWTARRSNQSILKEISPRCSMEGLMLKLKLQYFDHLMWRADSLEKTLSWEGLEAGGEGDDRGWDGWMASPTRWAWFWVNSESWWWTGRPGVLRFMGSQRVRHDWATELNWLISSGLRTMSVTWVLAYFQFFNQHLLPESFPWLLHLGITYTPYFPLSEYRPILVSCEIKD